MSTSDCFHKIYILEMRIDGSGLFAWISLTALSWTRFIVGIIGITNPHVVS